MSFKTHRERLFKELKDNSIVISYAGIPLHGNEDEYHNFDVNANFYYLTGLEREGIVLVMTKLNGETNEMLFIDEFDPHTVRWTGKMPTKEEVTAVSGVETVMYNPSFSGTIGTLLARAKVENLYMDVSRNSLTDLGDYNHKKAKFFTKRYPGLNLINLRDTLVPLREIKDEEEVEFTKKAIDVTRKGLENLMKNLKPGMMEYEAQADFEYACKKEETTKYAFNTIAGSGLNGCMLHYITNDSKIKDGDLLLLDLGAKYKNYCSDISRTYPANGKFTERQKEYYSLVLKANKEVAKAAKPGVTLKELNDLTKKILGEGLVAMGKIESADQVGKYYMHSISHSIGIICHDCMFTGDTLKPGWIISDEPGLYIDEEEIGIRIEDDLLITEDGCEVLSKDIIKEIEDIESFMKK